MPAHQLAPRCQRSTRPFAITRSGMWRSLVAYTHGVRVVAGSNPVIPTEGVLNNTKKVQTVENQGIEFSVVSFEFI